MKTIQLTDLQEAVVEALKKEHLTSFQILNRVKNTSFTIEVFSIIDDLNKKGILKSYIKEELKYHYVA